MNVMMPKVGKKLLDCIDLVFSVHRVYKRNLITQIFYLRKVKKIKKKMFYFLKDIQYQSDSIQAKRIAKNILKSFDMMWLFVKDENIPLTNNFAERQIKHMVKYQKNSYHTWSEKGDRFLERMKSICTTAKLRENNPFDQVKSLLLDSS